MSALQNETHMRASILNTPPPTATNPSVDRQFTIDIGTFDQMPIDKLSMLHVKRKSTGLDMEVDQELPLAESVSQQRQRPNNQVCLKTRHKWPPPTPPMGTSLAF